MNPRTKALILNASASYASPRLAAEQVLRAAAKREPDRDDKETAILAIQFAIEEARREAGR